MRPLRAERGATRGSKRSSMPIRFLASSRCLSCASLCGGGAGQLYNRFSAELKPGATFRFTDGVGGLSTQRGVSGAGDRVRSNRGAARADAMRPVPAPARAEAEAAGRSPERLRELGGAEAAPVTSSSGGRDRSFVCTAAGDVGDGDGADGSSGTLSGEAGSWRGRWSHWANSTSVRRGFERAHLQYTLSSGGFEPLMLMAMLRRTPSAWGAGWNQAYAHDMPPPRLSSTTS